MTAEATTEYVETAPPATANPDEARAEKRRRARDARISNVVALNPWKNELSFNDRGEPHSDLSNAVKALTFAPEWDGVLAYDEFRQCVITRVPPPWDLDYDDPERTLRVGDIPLADADVSRTAIWLARRAGIRVTPGIAYDALQVVSRTQRYHPVVEWLQKLKWDGTRRLDAWLSTYAGVPDSEYSRNVGRWWMISAVARVMHPGCKADHVLILEGTQGAGKSTLARMLAKRWFSDTPIDIGTKDAYLVLRGRVIVELAELDSLNRAEASRAKAFLSSNQDVYRPPYGREPVEMKRQCVFIGTVNHSSYLRDETGARRFWPVKAGHINVEGLKADVDQLWAEAMAYYGMDVPWYPQTDAERSLCDDEQRARYVADVWEERIVDWLARRKLKTDFDGWVSIPEILDLCLDIKPAMQDARAEQRVAKTLISLGWSHRRRPARLDAQRRRAYFAPDFATQEALNV